MGFLMDGPATLMCRCAKVCVLSRMRSPGQMFAVLQAPALCPSTGHVDKLSACRACNLQIDPHFDSPYLSTSLGDFWGRRWNLSAGNVLRFLVYEPIQQGVAAWVLHKLRVIGQEAAAVTWTGADGTQAGSTCSN